MLDDCLPLLGIAPACSRLCRSGNRVGRAPIDRGEPRQPTEEIAGGRPRHGRVSERKLGAKRGREHERDTQSIFYRENQQISPLPAAGRSDRYPLVGTMWYHIGTISYHSSWMLSRA